MTRLAVLFTAFALALPAVASAQADNPFAPLPPAPQAPTVTPTPPRSAVDDGGITPGLLFGMIGGLLVIFSVIGWVITRDARRTLPEDARREAPRDQGPHRHERGAKAKARKKARAQRQARKKTRRR